MKRTSDARVVLFAARKILRKKAELLPDRRTDERRAGCRDGGTNEGTGRNRKYSKEKNGQMDLDALLEIRGRT